MTTLRAFPSAEWLAALRARGSDPAFAHARRIALDERLARAQAALPDIPSRQAGYYHDYFCPTHAVQLVFDPREPHRHPCPVDGEVFAGEPFDSAWGWSVNDLLSDTALRSALRHAIGAGDPGQRGVDLAMVRHVLSGYAERYRTMPRSPKPYPGPYRGIACFSALDEDVFIIRLAWAAALTADALEGDDARLIREGLFEPAREHLSTVRYRQVQNVANWDNSALITLALLLGDDAAIPDILDGEFGVRDELARGVGTDGLWWEVSLSYHYYVLAALSWTVRALRASGRAADAPDVQARVADMFRAPLGLAFADGSLPAVNDCWYHIGLLGEVGHGIPNAEGFHELAWGWWGDAAFGRVLSANAARSGRATLEALLDGGALPPPADGPVGATSSRRLDDLAVLSSPDGLTAMMKAAAGDGDAHGHPEQLGLQLFGAGGRIAIDPGTPGYGIALNDTWYRQTGSHSTVLLDSASQAPAAARILAFDDGAVTAEARWATAADWPAVEARTRAIEWPQAPSAAYADVSMRRTVAVDGRVVRDEFTVDAPGERTIDWLLHVRGTYAGPSAPAPAGPDGLAGACGYDQLTEVRRLPAAADVVAFELPAGRLTIEFDTAPGEERFLASAPGNPAADRHLLLVRRVRAGHHTFRATLRVEPSA
jgi:hypothetical protein